MKFRFTKDFANNWEKDEVVPIEIKNNKQYLVDNVALIDIDLIINYGYIERDNNEEN